MCVEINVIQKIRDMMNEVKGVQSVIVDTPTIIYVTTMRDSTATSNNKDIYAKEREIMKMFPNLMFHFESMWEADNV